MSSFGHCLSKNWAAGHGHQVLVLCGFAAALGCALGTVAGCVRAACFGGAPQDQDRDGFMTCACCYDRGCGDVSGLGNIFSECCGGDPSVSGGVCEGEAVFVGIAACVVGSGVSAGGLLGYAVAHDSTLCAVRTASVFKACCTSSSASFEFDSAHQSFLEKTPEQAATMS